MGESVSLCSLLSLRSEMIECIVRNLNKIEHVTGVTSDREHPHCRKIAGLVEIVF